MEKIIDGHLVGFGSVKEIEHLKEDYYGEFTDAGMSEKIFSVYKSMPSKEKCKRMCAEMSGEVITYKLNEKD
ncbi:hypothetical protein [Lentibacillus amyloliquefaciens]|uniref:Uncharacterized protein n=1 Tax=Lentibacillus amyloliquefaciens TaxID=1472767 RepID=A0A0U4EB51_9BACI|nr:hypothetical protein [Lentibacillus amyloliquefaciens]ALX47785.1 hypothetical protein AOX59_03690 [Lentibacillus amyloliquefaciens]